MRGGLPVTGSRESFRKLTVSVCGHMCKCPRSIKLQGSGFVLRMPRNQIFQHLKPELSSLKNPSPKAWGEPSASAVQWPLSMSCRSVQSVCRQAFWLIVFATLTCIQTRGESSAGELPVACWFCLGLGHAQTRWGKAFLPCGLLSLPGGMQCLFYIMCAHCALY